MTGQKDPGRSMAASRPLSARENAILDALAERYRKSAHASGGRKLRLRPAQVFPDLSRTRPDEYESFLEACEELEKSGFVSIVWAKRARGEEVESLVLEDPEALFASLGRTSPADSCAASRKAALADADAGPFFAWLAENLAPRDLDPDSLEPRSSTITEAARLARALGRIARGETPPKLPRALSVELFSDSKRIEAILSAIQGQLRRAGRSEVPLPPFELADRSFPETYVAGALGLRLTGGGSIENSAGSIIGIPFETATKLESAVILESATSAKAPGSGTGSRLLSVENKESFFDLASRLETLPFDALLYSGGHPNRAVQSMIGLFASSLWTVYHAGDLDPDGILILQELSDAAGVPVLPWHMDRSVFTRYRALGRPLETEAHRRALLVRDDTRSRSGLGELLEAILESGVMVEQEIISYTAE